MRADQPQIVRVVCVPDPKHLAFPSFPRKQLDLIATSIAKHELDRIDMSLEEPPQRQAAGTDRLQDLAERRAR